MITQMQMICTCTRKGFSYFKSLAGDRVKLRNKDYKVGGYYTFRIETKKET